MSWIDECVGDEKMETAFLDYSLTVRMKLKEGKKKSRGRAKRDSLLSVVVCFIWDEMFSIFVGDKERCPLERQELMREA